MVFSSRAIHSSCEIRETVIATRDHSLTLTREAIFQQV